MNENRFNARPFEILIYLSQITFTFVPSVVHFENDGSRLVR